MAPRALNAPFHSAHCPVSSRHRDGLCHRMGEELLGDRFFNLDSYAHGDLMLSPSTWTQSLYQGTRVARTPQPSRLRIYMQPVFVRDVSPVGGRQRDEAQDSLNVADRSWSARRTRTCDTSGVNQACAGGAPETAGSNVPKNAGKGDEDSKWKFTVDMEDCSDVNVSTQGDILTVEGNGFNSDGNYRKSVQYVTRLPSNVRQDNLTARLNNGRLTVVQKVGAENAAVPIQGNQQQKALATGKKQTQQQQQQQQELTSEEKKSFL